MADEIKTIDLSSIDREIETNRWWQAFCSPAPHAFLAVSGADDIVTGQANWADKAIAEARKRGRL